MDKLRKAMAKEKVKAQKFNSKHLQKPFADSKSTGSSNNPLKLQKNLEGFTKQRGLIVGERVDHMAANRQMDRAVELSEIIVLREEEHSSIFDIQPQRPIDSYFTKLQSGAIKTAKVGSRDDYVDEEVQTDPIEVESKFNFAPQDISHNYGTTDDKNGRF